MSAMMQRLTSSFLSLTCHIMEWSYVESQANLVPILRSFPKRFTTLLAPVAMPQWCEIIGHLTALADSHFWRADGPKCIAGSVEDL